MGCGNSHKVDEKQIVESKRAKIDPTKKEDRNILVHKFEDHSHDDELKKKEAEEKAKREAAEKKKKAEEEELKRKQQEAHKKQIDEQAKKDADEKSKKEA